MKSRIWRLAGVSLLCLSVSAQVLADDRNDHGGDNHPRPQGQSRPQGGQVQHQQQEQHQQQQQQQIQHQQIQQQQVQQQQHQVQVQHQQQEQHQQAQQQVQQQHQELQRQQQAQQHLPIQSHPDEVRQTQSPRQGYYKDISHQDDHNQHWQAGNQGPRPGGGDGRPGNDHWQGRPDGHGNGWGSGPQYRPGHVINSVPGGHSRIGWHGQDYFYSGGYWYRPQGPHYVVVRPPYGIRVRALPDFSQEVWLGSTLFFVAAGTYYLYQPDTQEYVVANPPEGVEPIYTPPPAPAPAPAQGPTNGYDPVAYPANGQGPQQQQQDMYDCHMWAAGQSGFDPASATYAPQPAVADIYRRSMGACLTGRGYSVN